MNKPLAPFRLGSTEVARITAHLRQHGTREHAWHYSNEHGLTDAKKTFESTDYENPANPLAMLMTKDGNAVIFKPPAPETLAVIHNHSPHGYGLPSLDDIRTFLNQMRTAKKLKHTVIVHSDPSGRVTGSTVVSFNASPAQVSAVAKAFSDHVRAAYNRRREEIKAQPHAFLHIRAGDNLLSVDEEHALVSDFLSRSEFTMRHHPEKGFAWVDGRFEKRNVLLPLKGLLKRAAEAFFRLGG